MHTRYFIKQKRRKEGERPKERTGKDGRREGGGERAERKEGRKRRREEGGRRNEGERETVKTYGFQCSFETL